MRKLALALAAAATFGLATPVLAHEPPPTPFQVARDDVVKVKTVRHRPAARKVIVHKRVVHRHPRFHRHGHAHGRKVFVVKKKRPHRTVVHRKVIIRR